MTEEKITNLEINMAELKKDICYIKKGLDSNTFDHAEIKDCIKEVKEEIENLGDKFASKKIEVMVYSIMGFIFITLFGIIGYLLDKFVLAH
jgi:uncharacterized protein (UPF0335 family)